MQIGLYKVFIIQERDKKFCNIVKQIRLFQALNGTRR